MRVFGGTAAFFSVFLAAAGAQPKSPFNYGEALQKSLFFYDAQRSGPLGPANRVNWRGDSGLRDGADQGIDLTGGFYDAGDHVKFGFPMASSFTLLAWGALEYPAAYRDTKQMAPLLQNLRWATDYFMKASETPNQLWGQVGSGDADHGFWGPAEVMPMARLAFRITASCPGSDLAAETAAALASASLVFKNNDEPDYAAKLLARAESLYRFADTYRGKYSDCIPDANNFYRSWSGYNDELAWGAAWLYRATENQDYLAKAQLAYTQLGNEPGTSYHSYKWTHAWDDKSYGTYILLAQLTGRPEYREDAERWLDYWTTGFNGEHIRYTPGGLAWLDQWGSLRYSANTSLLAFIYGEWLQRNNLDLDRGTRYTSFAEQQINYMLGNNPRQSSFVVGFGLNPPRNVHHRTAHGSFADNINSPADSVHTLYGALVGGPDTSDGYADSRTDFVKNEVALDYNAGLTGALARMYRYHGGEALPNFPAAEIPSRDQFFVEAAINARGNDYTEIAAFVNNQSAWPARLAKTLTIRYFFKLDSDSISDVSLSQAFNQCSQVSGPFHWSEQTYFIQISCADVAPSGQSAYRKQVQFRLKSRGAWDSSNDWSMAALAYPSTGLVKTDRITLYENDVLIWGYEPPRGVPAELRILTPASLPTAVAGQPYLLKLSAIDGTPPYSSWTIVSGSLPEGLSLVAATGIIAGTPLASGTLTFGVEVADGAGAKASQELNLVVEPPPALKINTQTLSPGHVGAPYSVHLAASGGVQPYSWHLTMGELPAGLTLEDSIISGVPQLAGTASLTVEVEDRAGTHLSVSYELIIEQALPVPASQLRLQYRVQFQALRSNTIGPQLRIINDAPDSVPLSQLSVRYYFTLENAEPLNYWCDWAALNCNNIKTRFIAMGNDRVCLEITFAASAGDIPGGRDSGEIQSRFAKNNWSDFDQSNDYSFDAVKNRFADWDRITVYRNGTLVWGVEPE